MALKREEALKVITERIAWLVTLCEFRGAIHLLDGHTIAHELFCRILNEVYDLNLVVTDRIKANFPAIDLGDEEKKRSFQVTAEKGTDKIQATLEKYMKHDLQKIYGKIQVVIIGDKQGSYKSLTLPSGLSFSSDDDIISFKDLIKIIEALGTDKLERIAEIVRSEIKTDDLEGKLFLHTSVHNERRDYWPGGEDTRMSYIAELTGDSIVIYPAMPYLDRFAAGGPIEPLRCITPTYCAFDWNFPALDFKLLNGSVENPS